MLSRLFDQTLALLGRALDTRSVRHQAISANLANQDTPGYQAVEVDVRRALGAGNQNALTPLATTHPGHLAPTGAPAAPMAVEVQPGTATRLDGNTVRPEHELAKLSENALQYQAAVQALTAKFRILRTAIREGR